MERLDKVLSSFYSLSRADTKKLMKKQCVKVNGVVTKSLDIKVDPDKDDITVDGQKIVFKKHIYIMMNKPEGVISASDDKSAKTVVDLVPDELYRDGLFPAGRLDKDTTGFVLLTDDGDFAHRILSPKNHIEKTYHAVLERQLSEKDIEHFLSGVKLKDGTLCLEAKVRMLEGTTAEVIIHEGKYHQVKRMFAALGNKVIALRRVKMGNLPLDENLPEGDCREITSEELKLIEQR